MAQINTVIRIEQEASRKTWLDLFATAGMRRRSLITTMLGLFTQWSGNTLISYYLGDLLAMVGITDSLTKQKINLASSCWNLVCACTVALLVTTFRRRTMYLTCTVSLLLCYIAWTVSMQQASTAKDAGHPNQHAAVATIFFIFAYAPCYNIGYNALTYTYMVEIWPYTERSRGISLFQLFGRLASFFTTFVNPIGLQNAKWKYLISYCCWLAFEVTFVYFFFPETAGRTLEELAFSKLPSPVIPRRPNMPADFAPPQCLRTRRSPTRPTLPSRRPSTPTTWTMSRATRRMFRTSSTEPLERTLAYSATPSLVLF